MIQTLRRTSILLALLTGAIGCSGPARFATRDDTAIRLLDLYEPDQAQTAATTPARALARTEWDFSKGGAKSGASVGAMGWSAPHGVKSFQTRDGLLEGESLLDFPLLEVHRAAPSIGDDVVHSVEIRLRASAGSNLSIRFPDEETLDIKDLVQDAKDFPWGTTTPLIADGTMRTYSLRPVRSVRMSATRHLLVRPTDVAGASFAIESVRIVSRREHLSAIPSGIGWQGLSEIYRETLIARAPESLRFPLKLPANPILDLAIGTVEEGPVTFAVEIAGAGSGASARTVLKRTLTRPHRWQSVPIDLSEWAGQAIDLRLTLSSPISQALGFWGAPVVRSRIPVAAAAAATSPPRGVILIWADTLRRDHLSLYGYGRETSPELVRLAREGTLFTGCSSNATWTKVATPSLLTSLYPTSHGVADFSDRIPASAVTLPELYRDAGYATLGLSSVVFVGKFTNLHQGFEEFHEDSSLPKQTDHSDSKTAREYVDRLLPWIESHREVPFFVLLHVTDPHDPFRPYPPYDSMWADPASAEAHEKDQERARQVIADPLMKIFGMPTRAELVKAGIDADAYVAHDVDWYDGSIRGMDAEIGRLIERLRDLGLAESTLVVFTADHGEEFLEHGRSFHGQSVYGELTNAPLLLWRPGSVPAGRVVGQTVQTVDVMPTLIEASGLSAPAGMQGRSLMPMLSADQEERPAFTVRARTQEVGGAPPPREAESYALVSQGWKLVRHISRAAGESGPQFELFDRHADPLDQHDQAAAHPEIVARLAADLERIRSSSIAARLAPDAQAAGSLSAEELERLRSLGYIQ